jgi:hypothetical protein
MTEDKLNTIIDESISKVVNEIDTYRKYQGGHNEYTINNLYDNIRHETSSQWIIKHAKEILNVAKVPQNEIPQDVLQRIKQAIQTTKNSRPNYVGFATGTPMNLRYQNYQKTGKGYFMNEPD